MMDTPTAELANKNSVARWLYRNTDDFEKYLVLDEFWKNIPVVVRRAPQFPDLSLYNRLEWIANEMVYAEFQAISEVREEEPGDRLSNLIWIIEVLGSMRQMLEPFSRFKSEKSISNSLRIIK